MTIRRIGKKTASVNKEMIRCDDKIRQHDKATEGNKKS